MLKSSMFLRCDPRKYLPAKKYRTNIEVLSILDRSICILLLVVVAGDQYCQISQGSVGFIADDSHDECTPLTRQDLDISNSLVMR